MSIAVLGNTLTTDAKSTGTQALGKVHQDEEDELKDDDRDFVLDVLNYHMTDIFQDLGVDTRGGKFAYITTKQVDKTVQINVVEKLTNMGLPISDDYLYETFDIDKPEDYDSIKADMAVKAEEEKRRREETRMAFEQQLNNDRTPVKQSTKKPVVDRLKDFFGIAPQDGAPLEF